MCVWNDRHPCSDYLALKYVVQLGSCVSVLRTCHAHELRAAISAAVYYVCARAQLDLSK
jgi:hypothetical protein